MEEYRRYVGPVGKYDEMSATQFNLLTTLGLRERHTLLDIGCGSLRVGRLLIPYLGVGNYFGIEPNKWLVEEGIKAHVGDDLVRIKKPRFTDRSDFRLTALDSRFDYVLAQSIFSHASPQQVADCFAEARGVMLDDSLFLATFYEGDESYAGNEWVYPGNVTYRFADMQRMGRDAGLRAQRLSWAHPNGQTWMALVRSDSQRELADPGDAANLAVLRQELRATRAELERIVNHPVVRAARIARRVFRLGTAKPG